MSVRLRNKTTGVTVVVDEATAATLGPAYEPAEPETSSKRPARRASKTPDK